MTTKIRTTPDFKHAKKHFGMDTVPITTGLTPNTTGTSTGTVTVLSASAADRTRLPGSGEL